MSNSLRKLFSHLQSGHASGSWSIDVNKSKAAIAVLNVLQQHGYIRGYRFNSQKPRKTETLLKYKNQEPAICRWGYCIPSKKTYVGRSVIAPNHRRSGEQQRTLIVSTSKGVVSNATAHKLNVGGELICSIL